MFFTVGRMYVDAEPKTFAMAIEKILVPQLHLVLYPYPHRAHNHRHHGLVLRQGSGMAVTRSVDGKNNVTPPYNHANSLRYSAITS